MNTKIDPEKLNYNFDACIFVAGEFIVFDREDLDYVKAFCWHVKSGLHYKYAYREIEIHGKIKRVYMHRELSACPKNKVCHHINYCGLDNRKSNLKNMRADLHEFFHNRSTRPKKFPKKTTIKHYIEYKHR